MKYCPNCAKPIRIQVIESKDRFVCTDKSCGYIYWNNPIPVVGMIVETTEGIVVAHNVNTPEGVFSVITGFLESDERPEDAAIRETKEELGLTATEIEFLGVFPFSAANQILMVYHIKAEGNITAQITPHFLFNSLNTIYSIAEQEEATRSADSALKLSEMMRYPINEGTQKEVPINAEINFLKSYLDFQKIRLGGEYPIIFNLEGDFENKRIAPLLFISIVENTFKYGVSHQYKHPILLSLLDLQQKSGQLVKRLCSWILFVHI